MVVFYYIAKETGVYTVTIGESRSILVKVEPSTTYTITGTSWTKRIALFDNMPQNGDAPSYYLNNDTTKYEETSLTFTTLPTTQYLVFFNYNGSVEYPYNKTLNDVMGSVMLNLGSTALPYEPYGYKLPITIGGTEYPIYLGEVQTTRKIRKLVLTWEEDWNGTEQPGDPVFNNYFRIKYFTTALIGKVFCTHYVSPDENISVNNTIEGCKIQTSSEFTIVLIIRPPEWRTWSVNDFKSYLAAQYSAGTPVTIWYVLEKPETSTVNEPLMKIGDYADTISKSQSNLPIPITTGSNTLSIETTI
jgi:hypothetical protein